VKPTGSRARTARLSGRATRTIDRHDITSKSSVHSVASTNNVVIPRDIVDDHEDNANNCDVTVDATNDSLIIQDNSSIKTKENIVALNDMMT
jgi:hypothetical protein